MSARIRGQEVEILIVIGGQVQDTITDVRSFEIAPQLDILVEDYLGETTDRPDSIFRGVTGRMAIHIENDDIFDLWDSIINKARRRTPGTQINIKATLNFGNGDRPRVTLNDCEFGSLPLSFGSRADYGEVSLEFRAADIARA